MLVPLFGFMQGDTLGVVVLVQDGDPVRRIASSLAQACAPRVTPAGPLAVYRNDVELDLDITIAEAGITALDRVDVRWQAPARAKHV